MEHQYKLYDRLQGNLAIDAIAISYFGSFFRANVIHSCSKDRPAEKLAFLEASCIHQQNGWRSAMAFDKQLFVSLVISGRAALMLETLLFH